MEELAARVAIGNTEELDAGDDRIAEEKMDAANETRAWDELAT